MSAHLSDLLFEIVQEPVEAAPPKMRTMVHLEAPEGFLAAVNDSRSFPAIALDQLSRDLKKGPKSWAVRRWGNDLRSFQKQWHPFIRTEGMKGAIMTEDLAAVEEAATLFDLPPVVVWVGTVAIGLLLDRSRFFPRPGRPDRRLQVPVNAVFFPGVQPWGLNRGRPRQHS